MNLRVYNALRKIAADKAVKEQQSEIPFDPRSYEYERDYAARMYDMASGGNTYVRNFTSLYDPDTKEADYIRLRPEVARGLAMYQLGLAPGSDEYSQAIKYYMQRGDTNMYNSKNPSNPRPNPEVPEILKKQEQKVKATGNIIGSTNYGKRYSNVG